MWCHVCNSHRALIYCVICNRCRIKHSKLVIAVSSECYSDLYLLDVHEKKIYLQSQEIGNVSVAPAELPHKLAKLLLAIVIGRFHSIGFQYFLLSSLILLKSIDVTQGLQTHNQYQLSFLLSSVKPKRHKWFSDCVHENNYFTSKLHCSIKHKWDNKMRWCWLNQAKILSSKGIV